jgi:hypothetical protein
VNQAKADLDPRQFTDANHYLDALDALAQSIYDEITEPQPDNVSKPDFGKPNSADGAAAETMRQVAGDPPPTQADTSEKLAVGIGYVDVKHTRDNKRMYSIAGASFFGRDLFRGLGFPDEFIDSLDIDTDKRITLPQKVDVVYVMNGAYKNLSRARISGTDTVIDTNGNIVQKAS